MRASLDPLRYALRALDEMAREQASVAPPPPSRGDVFSPHPVLRPVARDGAAMSLRLYGDAADDATAFVLGDSLSHRFVPIPPRAGALFEASAAALAADLDGILTVGFPLAMFVQNGSTRAAPLFSRGAAHARWKISGGPWKLPPGARPGATLALPDALEITATEGEAYALHAGVWSFLFGLDGAALAAIALAGREGLGPLVRAATRALDAGGEEVADAEPPASGPFAREDLAAFTEAALRRAPSSRALRVHPHGLAMLPPRGDPTSGLRTDIQALLGETLAPRGPLAVYLGAPAAPPRSAPLYASGKAAPTASQLAAAQAFEGTEDLVAVCGPPGCGKTALLHHVAAHTVVACALGGRWVNAPSRGATWSLVVTSTNNAAVDQALAPFVGRGAMPIGIRLGNRRALAESTSSTLNAAIDAIHVTDGPSLADARAAFETRARVVRSFMREEQEQRKAGASAAARRRTLEGRATSLRAELARAGDAPTPNGALAELESALAALREHAEAAGKLPPIHLEGQKASVPRAAKKWGRANALRAPRIVPVLEALGLAVPFRDLDASDARADIERQHRAIDMSILDVERARAAVAAPELRRELEQVVAELGASPKELAGPPLDPELYDAALAVRNAWARAHRDLLLPRLVAARDAVRAEWSEARGKPVPLALREVAALFPIAGCTLLSMRASFPLGGEIIDRLVIDEAAQCAPAYAAPAIARARRVMLTGDVAQLPPVYTLAPQIDDRLAKGLDAAAITPFRMGAASSASAQAVAEPRSRSRLTLVEHFRSQPPIVALASRWSGYSLDVRTPPRSLSDVSPLLAQPVVVHAIPGAYARAPEGVVNEAEAAEAVALTADLLAVGVLPSDIAVLTPFVGQSVRIERALASRGLLAPGGVLVSTVHRLQGGERRVVIFSVTATERRHLRWLASQPHLLHVATSRAQDHLVVLVDPDAATREPVLAPFAELLTPRAERAARGSAQGTLLG